MYSLWRRNTGSPRLGGPSVEVGRRSLRLEDGLCQTLIVTGYPRDVRPGWAQPLLNHPGVIDAALHIDPVPAPLASTRLRRRRTRLESAWRTDAAHGRVEDPHQAAAAGDAAELAERVATGQSRLYRLAVYLTVHARTEDDLHARITDLRALAAGLLVGTAPATWRALHGWTSTLPLGADALQAGRSVDTDAVAAMIPFASPDPAPELGPTAVVYGENTHSQGLVLWDRFGGGLDNHNAVYLAASGAGKSYAAKLELLRSLMVGVQAAVIDPEDEYAALCESVGGTRIALGAEGRINPFDIPEGAKDGFTGRCLFAHTLTAAMVGALSAEEAAALDRAVITAYTCAGITRDPATWDRPAPLLRDVVQALEDDDEPEGAGLAAKVARYTTGSAAPLFDGPTTADASAEHLTVFSLRHLPEEARTIGMLLALDRTWNTVEHGDPMPRLITVDEGWVLLGNPVGAHYLYKLAKAGRKRWCGLTVITQDVGDVLATDLGKAVVANAATAVLGRQAAQNLDAVAGAFELSEGEKHMVATAGRGQALLVGESHRAGFHPFASPTEHALITTDPAELAAMDDNGGTEAPGGFGTDIDDELEERGW
ncbi:VirB4 family type IV secretion system protein [Nocardiopsis chromatogenes]|uniref:VirB4 family type IV secretion system protein n=1 Tax=Nocardiopsis chromatogenes TaxID=280239 RepID=UPI00034DB01F|nr:ATP-binding protein [Nocardiopsis chromatogenes]